MKKGIVYIGLLLAVLAALIIALTVGKGKRGKSILILDTDVGTDDAAAILLLAEKELDPDYLITTPGNAQADQAVKNANILKAYCGMKKTAIVAGLDLAKDASAEKNTFHGNDGLANIASDMAEALKLDEKALTAHITFDEMCEALEKADEITYIATGPVTNLAAISENEAIRGKIKCVYLMGGGLEEFNCSHDTEFNFSKNPEAVGKVLSSGLPITLFPLDLTNHQRVDGDQIDTLEKTGKFPEYITFLRFNLGANTEYNDIPAAVLHDCMPVLYAAESDAFTVEEKKLTSDEFGAVRESDEGNPIRVAVSVKEDLLLNTLKEIFD